MNKIELNGKTYIEEIQDDNPYVIIRSRDSGCHAGYLQEETDNYVVLKKSRRLWYFSGAASLSQLAIEGVSKPDDCKFPCEVDQIKVLNHCEVIQTTEKAKESIKAVKIWEA